MKSIKIKVSELKPDLEQPRKILEGLKELGESMKYKGQLTPIIISSDYGIIDGHRRYFAAKDIGIYYLDAVILNGKKKMTPFLKKAFPFAINVERKEFKAWDMADSICDIYWNYFLEEYIPKSRNDSGYSEFAKIMGISMTTVRDIIKTDTLAKKSKPLGEALKNKEIPVATLKEIANTPKEDHSYYLDFVKKESQKPTKSKSFLRDSLRDEKAKQNLRKKEELPNGYVSRIGIKIKTTNSLLSQSVLELATNEQIQRIKKMMKPLIKFYNKLDKFAKLEDKR